MQDKIEYILKYCRPYLKEQHNILKQVKCTERDGLDSIKSTSAANLQTTRHIQWLHKGHLGYSAKEYALIGMDKALQLTSDTGIYKYSGLAIKKHFFFFVSAEQATPEIITN